jgi:hypothetical protein
LRRRRSCRDHSSENEETYARRFHGVAPSIRAHSI